MKPKSNSPTDSNAGFSNGLTTPNPQDMNTTTNCFRLNITALALLLSTLNPQLSTVFAQGPLTPPPGAPAPAMKTLDQVEARKPIRPSTTSITIGAPDSYYLAGDIAVTGTGISITSGDVTLDLNGFTVRKSSGTGGTGIVVSGPADNSARNVTVRNGHIRGAFGSGVNIQRAHNVTIEDMAIQGTQSTGIEVPLSTLSTNVITVRRCRVLGEPVDRVPGPAVTAMVSMGISLRFGMACLVEDCVVANVAGDGIGILTANSGDTTTSGIIRGCVISRCGGNGVALAVNAPVPKGLLLERCTIDQCGGDGVNVVCPVRVVDCVSKSNTGEGFQFLSQAVISGCLAEGNGGDGIQISGDRCHLTNNTCASNTVAGIHLTSGANACRIDDNHATAGARAFHIEGSDNLIIRNSAQGATVANYDIAAVNHDAARVTSPGAAFASSSPWANFSF
jgi:parallel beta-helix repeat protein